VADAVSFYNGMGWDSGKADTWRFESHQWRMGKSLYEAREAYLENSPILYADKITTPLLIWTGSEDKQVNAVQSLELYLGMRRLSKKNILLRYPDERHSIEDSNRQKDLTLRVAQWFDYFLKDDPPTAWITEGLK
jgi:dipeptidyl aminopeptidase/acylaminoacyl peptidase